MNRLAHSSSTTLDNLLDTYANKSIESIDLFIEKRYTRFQQSDPNPTYMEVWNTIKDDDCDLKQIKSKQQFEYYCIKLNIDSYYFNTIVQTFSQLNSYQKALLLDHQLIEIKANKSNFHFIDRVIKARKNCIKNIRNTLEEVMKQSIARLSELDKLCMQMIHIRMLTLILIQAIYDWHYSLGTLFEQGMKQPKYIIKQTDILKDICEDTDFLRSTVLKKYLNFAKGFDPLLIRLTRLIRTRKQQISSKKMNESDRFSDFFQPDFNILTRLREAENILIKHYSKTTFITKQLLSQKVNNTLKFNEIKPQFLNEIKSSYQTKNISSEQKAEVISPQIIQNEGKINPEKSQQKSIGFIKKLEPIKRDYKVHTTKIQRPVEIQSPSSPSLKLKQQIRIIQKIKTFKQQLRNKSCIQQRYRTEQNQSINEISKQCKSLYKFLPALSDRKIIPISSNKKKITQKLQKLRFLKNNYRDSAKAELQQELRFIKDRVSMTIKKRKNKHKRERTNELQSKCFQKRPKSLDKINRSGKNIHKPFEF